MQAPVALASPSRNNAEGTPPRVWGIGGNRGAPSALICLGSKNMPPAYFCEPHPSKIASLTGRLNQANLALIPCGDTFHMHIFHHSPKYDSVEHIPSGCPRGELSFERSRFPAFARNQSEQETIPSGSSDRSFPVKTYGYRFPVFDFIGRSFGIFKPAFHLQLFIHAGIHAHPQGDLLNG